MDSVLCLPVTCPSLIATYPAPIWVLAQLKMLHYFGALKSFVPGAGPRSTTPHTESWVCGLHYRVTSLVFLVTPILTIIMTCTLYFVIFILSRFPVCLSVQWNISPMALTSRAFRFLLKQSDSMAGVSEITPKPA